jgi:predicted Zn-dependent peptidase
MSRSLAVLLAAAVVPLAGCPAAPPGAVPRLPADGDAHTARPRSGKAGAADPWAGRDLLPPPAPIEPRPLSMPPVHRFALPNGLEVVVVETDGVPLASFQLAIRAGRRHESGEQLGVASVTAAALVRGSARRTRAQLDAAAEAVGASLSASASFEATLLGCAVPSADLSTCATMLGELVAAPGLSEAQVAEARAEVVGSLRQSFADPAQLANLHLQNELWGDEHVRGWAASESAVGRLGRKDVLAWHKARVRPGNAILLVVGDVDRAPLEATLRKAFAGWRGGSAPAAPPMAAGGRQGMSIRVVDVPGALQAQIRVGQLGVAHKDEDFLAMTLVNHVLGGSASSRLATAVRSKLGPASAASSSFDRNEERGSLVLAGVAPSAQAVALMRLMVDEIGRLADKGPTEGEVARAVSEIAGGYAVRFDSPLELGNAVLAAALHGMDEASVRDLAVGVGGVGLAGARATAGRRLDGKNLAVVLLGDGKMIGRALEDAGLRFERVGVGQPITARDRAAAAEPPATAAASPEDEKAARAVLDAALVRKGGADRLAKIKTLRWKGTATLTMQGQKVPAELEKRFALPGKQRIDMTIDGGKVTVTTVLAGDQGWARQAQGDQQRVIDFPATEIEAARNQIWRDPDLVLLRHRDGDTKVLPQPDIEVDGVACHAIRLTGKGAGRTVVVMIDKQTKLLVGMRYSEQGQTAEERFSGYKKASGLEVAHQRVTRSSDIDVATTITEFAVDRPIDAALFVRPADK